MMKLIRTTVTGAVVFLLPIGILAFFVGKIVDDQRTSWWSRFRSICR